MVVGTAIANYSSDRDSKRRQEQWRRTAIEIVIANCGCGDHGGKQRQGRRQRTVRGAVIANHGSDGTAQEIANGATANDDSSKRQLGTATVNGDRDRNGEQRQGQ